VGLTFFELTGENQQRQRLAVRSSALPRSDPWIQWLSRRIRPRIMLIAFPSARTNKSTTASPENDRAPTPQPNRQLRRPVCTARIAHRHPRPPSKKRAARNEAAYPTKCRPYRHCQQRLYRGVCSSSPCSAFSWHSMPMASPRHGFQSLGIDLFAAGDTLAKASLANARKSTLDHLQKLTIVIALVKEKLFV